MSKIKMDWCFATNLNDLTIKVNNLCEKYDVIDFQVLEDFESGLTGKSLYTNGFVAVLKVRC